MAESIMLSGCLASRPSVVRCALAVLFPVTGYSVLSAGIGLKLKIQSTTLFKSSLIVCLLTAILTGLTDLCMFVPFGPCT